MNIGSLLTREAARKACEELDTFDDGADAWGMGAKVIIGCGGFWILVGLLEMLQNKYCFLAFGIIHVLAGLLILLLIKVSRRFRKWARKDFINDKTNSTAVKIFQAVVVLGGYIGLLVACAIIFGI